MLKIKIKSINHDALKLYTTFLSNIFTKRDITYNITNLPIKIKKLTLLKSPHVYKKAREQFQIIRNSKLISIKSKINNSILKYILINKPKMITLKITY